MHSQLLILIFLLFVSLPATAVADTCAPVPESKAHISKSLALKYEVEWKRAIDQDKPQDLQRLLPVVDAKVTNDKGKTALMAAVKIGDHCLMTQLLERGLKMSDRGYTGGTTLMYAVLGNQSKMIDLLLVQLSDLNAQSTNGWTAVMIAAAKGFAGAMAQLHAAGADVNLADVYQWTPLMRSVDNRHTDVAKYLLSTPGIDVDHVNENGSTVLHIAAQVGDAETVTRLLQLNAKVSIKDVNGFTPLDVAVANSHPEVADLIRQVVQK